MVVDLKHPIFGEYSTVNMPVQFSETPVGLSGPSPQFAVHTAEVLAEAGLDQSTIDALIADGVVLNRDEVT